MTHDPARAPDGRCVVSVGWAVVYDYDVADTGMRNLAVVALTDAGRSVTATRHARLPHICAIPG
jgi:hypothetical protein